MVTMEQAKQILLDHFPEATITAVIEHEGDYLFLAPRPDPLEGRFDPFFKVNGRTGAFRDFSPQEYSNPRDILDQFRAQADS